MSLTKLRAYREHRSVGVRDVRNWSGRTVKQAFDASFSDPFESRLTDASAQDVEKLRAGFPVISSEMKGP